MPVQPCPACYQQMLKHLHETNLVNYYTCEGCGHIWSIDKLYPSLVTHVMTLPQKPPIGSG